MLMVLLWLVHLTHETMKTAEKHPKYSHDYSGPDYSDAIRDTIKRYSRETNQPIGEIRQRLFAKTSANMKSGAIIMESKKLK